MDGFFLLLRNAVRFGLVATLGSALMFIGEMFISVTSTGIAYYLLTQLDYYKEKIYNPILPSIVVFFLAYSIGANFMTVYG